MLSVCLLSFPVMSAEGQNPAQTPTSNEFDERILALMTSSERLDEGKQLFQQICASCHSSDLSGGTGFNLKDGIWVHGGQPSQIAHNIENGFMMAGMPGFGGIFSQSQIASIVAYILSKKEGFEGLTYKLYQLDSPSDTVVTESKLIKSGAALGVLADFSMPEIQHYFIEFEGDFYAPNDMDTQIWLEWGFPHEFNVYIDGELQTRGGKPWYPTWKLKRGKQHLRLTYRSGDNKPNQRNLVLLGTNLDMTLKLFALSTRGQNVLDDKQFNVTSTESPVILRKRVLDLPPYTLVVGFPEQLNVGFNTRSCSVNALWKGDLMNIGPNISGRGEDPSIPLGESIFTYPQQLNFVEGTPNDKPENCTYRGYRLVDNYPVFSFSLGEQHLELSIRPIGRSEMTFNLTSTQSSSQTFLQLPQAEKLGWFVTDSSGLNEVSTETNISLLAGKAISIMARIDQ